MKITKIETFFVEPRWVFLKMDTDAGLVGWGEPSLEGWAHAVVGAVRQMTRQLIGADPRQVERNFQALCRGPFYRGGPVLTSAISGLEHAMWDIAGKALGVAAHELLGGRVRERIRMYAHVHGETCQEYASKAGSALGQGLKLVKTCPFGPVRPVEGAEFIEAAVRRVEALREAVGSGVDVALDFHGRTTAATAIRLCRALEHCRPVFVEEPCPPGDADALAAVARSTSIPIAAGERLYTRGDFREVFEKAAVAVAQPDCSHAGGILEVRKIAAMAEAYGVAVAPHCPLGPISLAACLQVDACTPNFLCQEQVCLGEGYLKRPFVIADGHVDVPAGPGLGIEVDEDALAEKLHDGDWDNPRLQHEDGSLADW